MMRRLFLLMTTGALMLALAASAAFAQGLPPGPDDEPGFDNEFIGTANSEVLFGTNADDRILGRGGHDYLNGLWGNDMLVGDTSQRGGPRGDDLIVGEAGPDTLLGGRGNDYVVAAYGYWQHAPDAPASPDFIQSGAGHDIIDAADRAGAPDDVRCGRGYDVVYAGVEDNVATSCEEVYRYFGY